MIRNKKKFERVFLGPKRGYDNVVYMLIIIVRWWLHDDIYELLNVFDDV